MRNSSDAVTLNVKKSTDMDTYTYDNIAIMLDGKEVGTIGMVADENEPYLERIDIDEKYRNKGIGTDALRLIAEKYGEFIIAPDNEDAKRLYERYGEESNSDNAPYLDQGYGVYSIYSVPEGKGYMARQKNVRYSMRRKLDSFDSKEYNEVKLGKQEYARLSTAIGTYQPNARGFVTQILDNEKGEPAYCYDVIVSDNRIVVLRKYGGTNIHEKRRYAASYRERKDAYRGTGGREYAGQSNNSDDLGLGRRATAGNDRVYQRRIEDKTKSYGRKFGENTSDSGERSRENLTVSDLGKIQYQLRIEDKNRLDILDKQETRLTADLKTLEKAYAEAIRAEYERSIKPSEETSRRATEINRKAAKRKPTEQKREPPAVVLFFICSARECSLLYHPVPAAAVQAALREIPPAHRQGKHPFRSSSYTPSMP